MLFSSDIWQMTGALMLSGVLVFVIYILPVCLFIACIVMLCMKKFAGKRAILLAICAVLISWILLSYVFSFS